MPRTSEQNKRVREAARNNILDAALDLYVSYGYSGTVMDQVAEKAGIAKGLLYYYYKTKNELFKDLFNNTMQHISSASEDFFLKNTENDAVFKLVRYSVDIFDLSKQNPKLIQFAMRMPFDAYAVFGASGWQKGMEGSDLHTRNLQRIIQDGIKEGSIKCLNPESAAASFWTVYVAGLYKFTKMMDGSGDSTLTVNNELENLLHFGMTALGIPESKWKKILHKL